MKRIWDRFPALLLLAALALGLCTPVGAFEAPQGFWPVFNSWLEASNNKDMDAYLERAPKVYDMIKDLPRDYQLCTDFLSPISRKASWLSEMKGDLEGAAMWLERQLEANRWLDENGNSMQDYLISGASRMNALTREMEIYALAEHPADVPYRGSRGEPVTGLLYGTIPGVAHLKDSASLMYVEFQDGYSMDYWLDYYCQLDPVLERAINSGVVEVAWNFPEWDKELSKVLSAQSYIAESVKALGSRGGTFLLRPGAEMNTWKADPAKYIQAFQMVAREARKYGNIALVYSPVEIGERGTSFDTYYPGDEWVDWIGVSSYRRGIQGLSNYEYDNSSYDDDAYFVQGIYGGDPMLALCELSQFSNAHNKPAMISECGFNYRDQATGEDKTAYALDMMNKFYSYLPMVCPQVKAVFLFNNTIQGEQYSYALSGSPQSAALYESLVTGDGFIQQGQTRAGGYTRLSTLSESQDTLTLGTYVSLPGRGETQCTYTLDGRPVSAETREPFTLKLKVSELGQGTHVLKATATKGQFSKSVERSFTVGGNSVVYGFAAQPGTVGSFRDVLLTDWFAPYVQWALERNITAGTTATTFSPDDKCTVAQILTLMWNAQGKPEPTAANPFTDVPNDYYTKAAIWAYEQKMVEAGALKPGDPCTRAMVVTYLWKQAGSPGGSDSAFGDVPRGTALSQAVAWAVAKGITSGVSPNRFDPESTCTRAQIVTFLCKAAQ